MPKKEYLGEIDSLELLGKLFENKNREKSLIDLKKTLRYPASVVRHMLEGISTEQLDKEIYEARLGKEKGFAEIYDKYDWMQVTSIENIYISEEGKVYDTCSRGDCRCDSKTCGD